MKALIQRVTSGAVTIDGKVNGTVGRGLVILLCVVPEDTLELADYLADRCAGLRIFEDGEGKMNRSLIDEEGGALVISQFTLCADVSHGRRPYFGGAAAPEQAIPLYERFMAKLCELGVPVGHGEFGADMQVEIHNDGPVTLMLEALLSANGKPMLK